MEAILKRHIHIYKDKYPLTALTTTEIIEEFQEMEVRKEDVFIVTYPKSGTHWMREIVQLIHANGDPDQVIKAGRGVMAEMADTSDIKRVNESAPVFRLMKDLPSPRVFATHVQLPLLPKQIWQKQCKVIYVCRHPKDVIVSFYNFQIKIYNLLLATTVADTPELFDDFFSRCLAGKVEYGTWFHHILEYSEHMNKDDFFFISYEDIKRDPLSAIKRVAGFLGRELQEDILQKILDETSFKKMKESYQEEAKKKASSTEGKFRFDIFFNKGETDQWKTRFTEEQSKTFDELFIQNMKNCELTRRYAPTEQPL